MREAVLQSIFQLKWIQQRKKKTVTIIQSICLSKLVYWTANIESGKKIISKKLEHLFKNRTQRALFFGEKSLKTSHYTSLHHGNIPWEEAPTSKLHPLLQFRFP
jgi:hypothetical protein